MTNLKELLLVEYENKKEYLPFIIVNRIIMVAKMKLNRDKYFSGILRDKTNNENKQDSNHVV